jgi:O-antigen/teichoic acid export membrane protein
MVTSSRVFRHATAQARRLPDAVSEQMLVVMAQLASGGANLLFAIVMAHVLLARDFAVLRAFLALNLVLQLPIGGITAGSALRPDLVRSAHRRTLRIASGIGALIVLCSVPLGAVLRIPIPMVVALAVSVPAAAMLALKRGPLWATGRHGLGAASLFLEAVGRFILGVVFAMMFGALGGVAGVVLGGYAALALVSARTSEQNQTPASKSVVHVGARNKRGAGWTMVAFWLLAVIQTQDLLFANKLLPATEAARFAAVSTLGGVAAFASPGVATLLLPRAARGERDALRVALIIVAIMGGLAVLGAAVAPQRIAILILGDQYASAGSLLVPFMVAMAIFGIGRVLAAERCASGRAGCVSGVLLAVGVLQSAALGLIADEAADVVAITLLSTLLFTIAMAAVPWYPKAS